MKSLNQWTLILLAVAIASAIAMSGCATTGMERSTKAKTSMTEMDRTIKLLLVQMDVTGESLRKVVKSGNPDVRKSFELYAENVSEMEEMEESFTKHAEEMNARGKDYFEEWEKEGGEYKNPRIQNLSEQRRLELSRIYGEIAKNSIGVKEELNSYVSDLKEIRKYLSNDLTPNGIEDIKPLAREVVSNGRQLKVGIKDIQAAVNRANAAMAR